MCTTEKLKKKLFSTENISLFLSLISLLVSIPIAIISLGIANASLNTANTANDIAIGRSRLLPLIKISSYPNKIIFINEQIEKNNPDFQFSLINTGDVPIDQLTIELFFDPASTTSYSSSSINAVGGLISTIKTVDLNSQFNSGGFLSIDLTGPIIEILRKMNLSPSDEVYNSIINIVFLPRKVGDRLPIQAPGNTANDRIAISVNFTPEILTGEEMNNYLSSFDDIPYNITNYPSNTITP